MCIKSVSHTVWGVTPLILGRPLLAAKRALIDVQEGNFTMRVNNEQLTLKIFSSLKHSNNKKECFSIRVTDK
ncbi:hypothetical protein E1A91_D01G171100v1, partial [Gossypium mustelinum]